MKQKITSSGTALNQVPGLIRRVPKVLRTPDFWASMPTVLDYGGGPFDATSEFLGRRGASNLVYDPFNRSKRHNAAVLRTLRRQPAAAAFCANVLNVIRYRAVRQEALELIRELTDPDGPVFIDSWVGDGSSRGRRTRVGWQANRPPKNYLREVRRVFPSAVWRGGLIAARCPELS